MPSIRGRLVLLLALAILPIGIVGLAFAIDGHDRQRRNFVDSVKMAADFVADDRERLLLGARRFLVAVASDFDVERAGEPACAKGLRRTLSTSPGFAGLGYLDRRGDLVCSSASLTSPVNLGSAAWFKQALGGAALAISRSVKGLSDPTKVVYVAIPLHTQPKSIGGVLSASVVAEALGRRPPSLRHLEGAQVAVLDANGDLIVAATATAAGDRTAGAEAWLPPPEVVASRLAARDRLFEYTPADGRGHLYALRPIADGLAISLLAVPLETRMRSIWIGFAAVAVLPIVMWIVAVGTAWFGIDRLIVRPVLRLQRVTAAYASGHFRYRQPLLKSAAPEIRDLGLRLNRMADAIQSRTEDLKASADRNRTLVREIHHRVKNNLQLIASIIGAHQRATDDEDEIDLLTEIASRVRALGLVHAQFDDPDDAMAIDLSDLAGALVGRHQIAAAPAVDHWDIRLAAENDCWIGIDDAVPFALLVSELLTAEPDPMPGAARPVMEIAIRRQAQGHVDVAIGIDCADARRLVDAKVTVAARLVDAFLRQLQGSVTIDGTDELDIAMRLAAVVPQGEAD